MIYRKETEKKRIYAKPQYIVNSHNQNTRYSRHEHKYRYPALAGARH